MREAQGCDRASFFRRKSGDERRATGREERRCARSRLLDRQTQKHTQPVAHSLTVRPAPPDHPRHQHHHQHAATASATAATPTPQARARERERTRRPSFPSTRPARSLSPAGDLGAPLRRASFPPLTQRREVGGRSDQSKRRRAHDGERGLSLQLVVPFRARAFSFFKTHCGLSMCVSLSLVVVSACFEASKRPTPRCSLSSSRSPPTPPTPTPTPPNANALSFSFNAKPPKTKQNKTTNADPLLPPHVPPGQGAPVQMVQHLQPARPRARAQGGVPCRAVAPRAPVQLPRLARAQVRAEGDYFSCCCLLFVSRARHCWLLWLCPERVE
jgi:hypothetical protein